MEPADKLFGGARHRSKKNCMERTNVLKSTSEAGNRTLRIWCRVKSGQRYQDCAVILLSMTHRREVLGKHAGVEYGYNRFRANSRVFALTD